MTSRRGSILLDGLVAAFTPNGDGLYLLGGFFVDGYSGYFVAGRAMTFGLVHSGIFHILFNGYAMMMLSGVTESHLGARRTVVLIAASQIGAALGTWLWYFRVNGEPVFTVGASGWVSGLLGYALVYTWFLGASGAASRRELTQWAIYILLFGFFMGANNMGHIGGAIGGALVGLADNRPGSGARGAARVWDKEATSQNYYSYSNSQKKELAFLPFTNSTYQMSAPKKGMTLYFTKNNKVTIVHQQDTIAQNIEFSNIQNTIHQNLDDGTPELSFCFDKNLSFNQYIQYKVWLYLNMQKWFIDPNKTVVEYIY